MKFIDVHTFIPFTGIERTVSLAISRNTRIFLLGNLEHNTEILVDQKLVDELQAYLDEKEKHETK